MSSPAQRLFLCFVVGLGLLLNVCSAYRAWAARVGFDLAELSELEGQVAQGEREAARKDRESRTFATLARARHEIAGEVIRGRMGLFEAAAYFRDMNGARADDGRMVRAAYAGSYDEQCCRQVISWVAGRLAVEAPARVACVTTRLEAELQERLRQQGAIRLQP